MLKGLRIPTHRADAPGIFIFAKDDAWDVARIEAEAAELVEMYRAKVLGQALTTAAQVRGVAVEDLPADVRIEVEASVALTDAEVEAARNRHPVARYIRGESRFDLAAPDQGPRGPVGSVAEYLRPGAEPTEFVLRRFGHIRRMEIELERSLEHRFARLVRAGVAAIRCGATVHWQASGPDDQLPDEWMDAIADMPGEHPMIVLAGACKRYSDPLTDAEGKR